MDQNALTKDQRWAVADRLAAERLPAINATCREVHPSDTFYARYVKRLVDIAVSSVALVVTLPINAAIAAVTYFDVGAPILFRQKRVGKDGELFEIIKFRNMTNERDERGDLLPAQYRVTKWGAFVRKTSLDELLNFWSVFKGDMSIIGPRPLVPEYTHRYNDFHKARLLVRPGLECPPRDLSHVWTWQEQLDNDVWYVENLSFATDLKMFCNLIRFALDRKASSARSLVKRGTFMGYSEDGQAVTVEDLPESYILSVVGGVERG